MKRLSMMLSSRPSKRGVASSDPESPEQVAMKGVRLFCESGTPSNSMQRGEEITILPSIVDAAESSPQAASSAAYQIRKYLSKDHYSYPYKQYNAIMLMRILVDNPGKGFTKNIDEKFKETIAKLLKESRDPSLQQMIRDTLNAFEREKSDDENLAPLLKMWRKEKKNVPQAQYGGPTPSFQGRGLYQTNWQQQNQQQFHANGRPRHALPDPEELSGRVEEARTSAKLLIQLVQTTPPEDVINNDLIKEFAERCQSAQRNLHGYMNCTDPSPDEPTFQTLIETTEQLSMASSKHQRALLAARRQNSQNNVAVQKAERLHDDGHQAGNSESRLSPPLSQQNGMPGRQKIHPASANMSPPAQNDPFSDVNQIPSSAPSQGQYNYPPPPDRPGQSSTRHYNGPALTAAPMGSTNRQSTGYQPSAGYGQDQYPPSNRLSTSAQNYRPQPASPGVAELSGTTTPPVKNEGFTSRQIDDVHVPPPPGPPPGRAAIPSVQTPHLNNDNNDLYDTSPVASRNGPPSAVSSLDKRPRSAGLYSVDSEVHRLSHDARSANNHSRTQYTPLSAQALQSHDDHHQGSFQNNNRPSEATSARKPVSAAWGEAETPVAEKSQQRGMLEHSRMKDDEPMTPALGVSGAGWQY